VVRSFLARRNTHCRNVRLAACATFQRGTALGGSGRSTILQGREDRGAVDAAGGGLAPLRSGGEPFSGLPHLMGRRAWSAENLLYVIGGPGDA